jgi:hypothetical protein
MANWFVEVPVTRDSATLADDAVDRLAARWDDWTPEDADQEVIFIEAIAPMASNAAEATARVPSAILRTFGEKLHGIPYSTGLPASATVTFHMADAAAHQIPEGFAVQIDGYVFTVDSDTPTAALSVPGVPVTAAVFGTQANDLQGDVVIPLSSGAAIASVSLDAPTADGIDPEDDPAYQDKVSRELELQSRTLVTPRNFEIAALDTPGIGRAVAVVNPIARVMNVFVTNLDGEVASAPAKAAVADRFAEYIVSNWLATVEDATYTPVDVDYAVHPYSFAPSDLVSRIDAMLTATLAPAEWGKPKTTGDSSLSRNAWVADRVVRRNKLIDLIADVEGVDFVSDVTIAGADVDGNLTLPGTVALPRPGVFTGSLV